MFLKSYHKNHIIKIISNQVCEFVPKSVSPADVLVPPKIFRPPMKLGNITGGCWLWQSMVVVAN